MGGNTPSKPKVREQKTLRAQQFEADRSGPFAEFKTLLLDDVKYESELGSGSYATVRKATCKGELFAAKQLHESNLAIASIEEREFMMKQFARECSLLQRADHPNVVRFVGLHMQGSQSVPFLLMELMKSTLTQHIETNGSPEPPTAYSILSDVALGLQFLHKHISPIIHRDLSANNVLLSSSLQAKISDLGMAKIIDLSKSKQTQTKAPGTFSYMPPEALQDKPIYDTSIDTFSFGVLMLHVLSGEWPMPLHGTQSDPDNPGKLIALNELERRAKYADIVGWNHALMPLVEKCLSYIPEKRPSASDIAETVMKHMGMVVKPIVYVATKDHAPKTSYELRAQRGDRFLVHSGEVGERSLVKVAAISGHQVGYIPKKILHKLDNLYVTTKAHQPNGRDELKVSSNEFVLVLNSDGYRLYVRSLSSEKSGYVPSKQIVKYKPMDEIDWNFASLSKDQAISLLSRPLNGEGVFLVTDENDNEDSDNKVLYVKHNDKVVPYKIIQAASGNYGVEITDKEVFYQRFFSSLEDLLLYHSGKKDDICTRLEKPCVYKYPSIWEIKDEEIEMSKQLSHRTGAEMWKGACGKNIVQGKLFKVAAEDIEEVEVMKRLSQPNIVLFHGVMVQKYQITMVLEYLEWETLYDKGKISTFPINVCIPIFRKVLNGLAHIQSMGVIHLNFGARSVLYSENPDLQCKITNFEFSQRIDVSNQVENIAGLDVRFLPPEVFDGKWLHVNSDVWSFGIFIQEILTACTQPYHNLTESEVVAKVKLGHQMTRPSNCPELLHEIVRECWVMAPDKRPSFESLQPKLRTLTTRLTVDGRPIPIPRTRSQKSEIVKPIPKPRKKVQQNYTNTTILPSPERVSTPDPKSQQAPPLIKSPSSFIPTPPPPKRSQNGEYQIKRKELKMICKVRSHLEDDIWEAVWKDNKPVLVTVQPTETPDQISIMKKFKHDNVLKLFGICTLENPIYIISEPMKPGSLLTFLRSNKGALEAEALLQMAIDISKGVAYLHSHYLIHRDLRADTILLDENNTCKVAHFNYVRKVDEATHTYTGVGVERIAVRWAAPEAIMQGIFSTRSDIWSLGIVLYEIVTYGEIPYNNMKNADAVKWVADGNRMPQPDNIFCPSPVYDIMCRCWDQKPDSRPSSIVLPQQLRDLLYEENKIQEEEEEEFDGYISVFEEMPEKDWNIEFADLSFEETIVQGKSGNIIRGKLNNDTLVAIKSISVRPIEGENQQQVEIMKKVNHKNIIRFLGTCTKDNFTHVITQYMQHGNLCKYLQYNSHSLELADLVTCSCQICDGMAYLEDQGIIHGNLSAAKVLVGEEEPGKIICKIIGMFGTEEDRLKVGFTIKIHPKWMAPETAVEEIYLQQSDVWAFGVVLYEIMSLGLEPYPGITNDEVLDQVIRGYRMPKPDSCKDGVYSLMLECWDEDPSRRPSFQSILACLNDVETYEDLEVSVNTKAYFDVKKVDDSEGKIDDVKLEVKIAESTTGDIWRGTWRGINVGIKYPKASKTYKCFELMKNLKNPNILQVFHIFSGNQSPCIVMEYMSRGNLEDYIAWEGSFLVLEKLIEMAVQCANGMCFLEENNIIHGNLTAHNILVGDNLVCKITGIMGSGIDDENSQAEQEKFHLPYEWRAVETTTQGHFDTKSDIWSFGIVLYVIMTHGEFPYEEIHDHKGEYQSPKFSKDVYNIIFDCWNEDPNKRLPFHTIERKLEDIIAYDSMPTEEEWPWCINPIDLRRIAKIADSQSGEVWRGMFRGKKEVAVLCPDLQSISIEMAAAELMKSLKHPHILSVFGICPAPDDLRWILTEMMINGELKKYIQRVQQELSVQHLVHIAAQCASGMLYLEDKGIIHGNLMASRVLVGESLDCKISGIIGDGVTPEDPYDHYSTKAVFLPTKWRAPETIKNDDFTLATDVWCFGILLYEIMSYGKDPYASMSNATASEEIRKGNPMECPPNSPRQFSNLLLDCWAKNPDLRPKFDNITLRLQNLLKFMLSEYETQEPAPVQTSLHVQPGDITFEKKLATGKSGDIWKGLLRQKKPVAIQVSLEKNEQWISSISKLKHQNILSLEGICYTLEEVYIITEYMENENLVKYLRGIGRSLKLQQLMHVAMQVCAGMTYLKSQQVLHRDLCARNVLVGRQLEIKITGILGNWSEVVDNPYYEEKVYTPPIKWAAPEAALYGNFSYQSDIWSLGIVLYEIVTRGRFPYPGMTRHEVISKLDDGYRMPCPKGCPSPLYDIMKKCWEEDPVARYTIEQLSAKIQDYHQSLSTEKQEWEVGEGDIKKESKIGESSSGEELWRGTFKEKPVLIKYCLSQPLKEFVHEAEVLQSLSHQNILSFHGFSSRGKIFMVLEHIKSHNFLQYLQSVQFPLKHGEILDKAMDVASGVAYLHRQGIILRYLSASSIMIGYDNKCKISNLKGAITQERLSPRHSLIGTRWMAVEVLSNNLYSLKSDVWAFAIFLYELVTHGQLPYIGFTEGLVCARVKEGFRMPAPPGCPTGLYALMEECWKEDPMQRPKFEHINGKLESLRTQNNQWEISKGSILKRESIWKDKNGDLHRGEMKKTKVVLKYYSKSCTKEEFLWEAEILKLLNHENILKLKAVCIKTTVPFIVLEDVQTSLFTAVCQTSISITDTLMATIQVAKGMEYLQQQGIIHRSLMARNAVMCGNICKLSNFGDSVMYGRELTQLQKDTKLPLRWIAPESVYSKSYDLNSDIWSFGVLLHEVFEKGNKPYNDMKDIKTITVNLQGGYRMPCPKMCPQSVYNLIMECWSEDPESRPTFTSISKKLEKIVEDLKWEVQPDEVKTIKELDHTGRYCEVWEGQFRGMRVAVKYHKKGPCKPLEFLWEAELLKMLNHPHVIQLLGLNSNKEKTFAILTYMEHGSLLGYIKTKGRSLTVKSLVNMAVQVASGMAYLQTFEIIHCDLAARSVLVGENDKVVISDFSESLCSTINDYPSHKEGQLAWKWLPPEAIEENIFDNHTDIWSYGILLYEIVTCGETPYRGMSAVESVQKVKEGYRLPSTSNCPEDMYSFMMKCWEKEPTVRPSFETAHLQMQTICSKCLNAPIVSKKSLKKAPLPTMRTRTSTTIGDDKWEIDRSLVKLESKHEEGRFGEVWKGYLKGTELVAIKIPKLDRTTISEFLHESEIMKLLYHPNIVHFKGVCTKGESSCIIIEYMPHGNLVKYLKSPAGRTLSTTKLLMWAIQVCNGLVHLGREKIIHRDVAARNILLGNELVCKIADFGLAQKVSGHTYKESSRTQFPLKWMAPETVEERTFSFKSDVWAFGILLYEMVTRGALPYPGVQNRDVTQLVKAGYRMPCPRGCPKAVYEVMDSSWRAKPEDRPDFTAIKYKLDSIKHSP